MKMDWLVVLVRRSHYQYLRQATQIMAIEVHRV
jgi:hypothetical protein